VSVTSPYLEVADIILAGNLEQSKKQGAPSPPLALKASLQADAGKAWGIGFEKLQSTIILENNILYLQPLKFTALEGDISGKARIDFGSTGSPHYQLSYNLKEVSAESFMQAAGSKNRR